MIQDQQSVKYSEGYVVKFWHKNSEGFWTQSTRSYYAADRDAHQSVENYAIAELRMSHNMAEIVSVVYQ